MFSARQRLHLAIEDRRRSRARRALSGSPGRSGRRPGWSPPRPCRRPCGRCSGIVAAGVGRHDRIEDAVDHHHLARRWAAARRARCRRRAARGAAVSSRRSRVSSPQGMAKTPACPFRSPMPARLIDGADLQRIGGVQRARRRHLARGWPPRAPDGRRPSGRRRSRG